MFRVHLEQMDNQDLLDLLDHLVHKVTQECKVLWDRKDQLEILVQQANQVFPCVLAYFSSVFSLMTDEIIGVRILTDFYMLFV